MRFALGVLVFAVAAILAGHSRERAWTRINLAGTPSVLFTVWFLILRFNYGVPLTDLDIATPLIGLFAAVLGVVSLPWFVSWLSGEPYELRIRGKRGD